MQKTKGRVTLPAEAGQEEIVKQLIEQWGVDAIRDSDGTTLSDDILEMDFPIYSTICLVRAEQSWPREHPEDPPQAFLATPYQTYVGEPLEFDLMRDWFPEKYRINEVPVALPWKTTFWIATTTGWRHGRNGFAIPFRPTRIPCSRSRMSWPMPPGWRSSGKGVFNPRSGWSTART